ncbi:MAG: hypothetical protein ACNI27_08320 [Desulfovibrio sp.]
MSTIMPQSELTKKAIKWICDELENTDKPLKELIEHAGMQFNLSPLDMEFLKRFYEDHKKGC